MAAWRPMHACMAGAARLAHAQCTAPRAAAHSNSGPRRLRTTQRTSCPLSRPPSRPTTRSPLWCSSHSLSSWRAPSCWTTASAPQTATARTTTAARRRATRRARCRAAPPSSGLSCAPAPLQRRSSCAAGCVLHTPASSTCWQHCTVLSVLGVAAAPQPPNACPCRRPPSGGSGHVRRDGRQLHVVRCKWLPVCHHHGPDGCRGAAATAGTRAP